ncbi:MAG: AMP-binding protein, partial [bacterium]|nr:AMP-binding protein [bacterium]
SHHIILDGWCLGIVYGELFDYYRCYKDGGDITTLEMETVYPYRDFIEWLSLRERESAREYWRDYLGDLQQPVLLPRTGQTGSDAEQNRKPRSVEFMLDGALTQRLEVVAGGFNVTFNTLFRTIWGVLLSKYNYSDDVVFGSVVSGRPPEVTGIEKMVGLFINTVPVRIREKLKGDGSLAGMLERTQEEALKNRDYEYYPLVEIQALTSFKQELFDHIVVFENYPVKDELRNLTTENWVGFSVENMDTFDLTHYGLTLLVMPGKELKLRLDYDRAVYSPDLMEDIKSRLLTLFDRVVTEPGVDLTGLSMLTEEEERTILYTFNDTARECPLEKSIDRLFEEQVERNGNAVAFIGEGRNPVTVTYNELNARAEETAFLLHEKGVAEESIIAVETERTVEMIVVLLAILKTGSAYMPIDPSYPKERQEFMLKDSNATLLITRQDSLHFELQPLSPARRASGVPRAACPWRPVKP